QAPASSRRLRRRPLMRFEFQLYSFTHLTQDAETHVETSHRGKEIVPVGGARDHRAASETAATHHPRLAVTSYQFDASSAHSASRVQALAIFVVIRIVPV